MPIANYTTSVDALRSAGEIQVFLPYMVTGENKTLYEFMQGHEFMLTEGNKGRVEE